LVSVTGSKTAASFANLSLNSSILF
jgi:hypothetical protein